VLWTVVLVQSVFLWLFFSIFKRAWELRAVRDRRLLGLPRAARVQKLWGVLRAVVRLASTARIEPGCSVSGLDAGATEKSVHWRAGWENVAHSREVRKDALSKREFDFGSVIVRALGPVLFSVVFLLVTFEIRCFYVVALPWFQLDPKVHLGVVLPTASLSARCLFDYACVSFTDPGAPDIEAPLDLEFGERGVVPLSAWCTKCDGPKPPRCHHCRVCRRCVLKMDHHCMFVNNCVGLRNHRNFCFFVWNVAFGSCLIAAFLAPQLLTALRGISTIGPSPVPVPVPRRVHVIVAFLLDVVAACLLVPFSCFHFQLALRNETTIERESRIKQRGLGEQIYDRGVLHNFVDFLGVPLVCHRWRIGASLSSFVGSGARKRKV